MKILSRFLAPVATMLMPFIMFAQSNQTSDIGYFTDFAAQITVLINSVLVPLVFALALLAFFWGMFKTFILGGGDEEKQAEGKQLMMYAIVGFVVMVALWGIVNLLINVFDIGGATPPSIPLPPK